VKSPRWTAEHLEDIADATVDPPAAIVRIRRAEHIDQVPDGFGHFRFFGMDRYELVALGIVIAPCNQTSYPSLSIGPLSIAVLRTTYRKSMQKSKFGCWPAAGRDLPVFWPSEATVLL
jgi:hypothetical protein